MSSDKHNSRTAGARDLISSLINVASSRDVPFHQPQLLQCLHQGATFVPLLISHTFLHNHVRWRFAVATHEMATVWDIKIDEALLMLCLAYYVMKRVRHCRNETLWLSRIKIRGARFTSIFSIFSVLMAGWIAEMLFMLLFAYIAV